MNPIAEQLTHLEYAGLIRLAQIRPEIEYLFRHALIQDAVYDSLLNKDRKRLHLEVASVIKTLFPNRETEFAATLAHHFIEAEDAPRALYYLTLAADRSAARYAHPEAEVLYRSALEWVSTDADRVLLMAGLAESVAYQSRFDEAIPLFQEAIALGRRLNSIETVARCYARMSWTSWQGGLVGQAAQFCDEGLEFLKDAPPSHGLALLMQEAARANAFVGSVAHARDLCQRALEIARQFDIKSVQAEVLNTLATLSWGIEQPDDIIAMARESVAIADSIGMLTGGARAHNNLGSALGDGMGRWREARFHFRRGAELNTELGFKAGMMFCMGNAVSMTLFLGELRSAQKQLAALSAIRDSLTGNNAATYVFQLMNTRLMRHEGKLEQAFQDFFGQYRGAREDRNSQGMMELLGWLADVAYEMGRLDEVLPELEQVPEETFYVVFAILHRSYQAIAYAQQGRWDDSQAAMDHAHSLSDTIPGNWGEVWLRMAEARLAALSGRTDDALALYESISDELVRREMRWQRAMLMAEWAEVALTAGKRARALHLMMDAKKEFDAMGVSYYASAVAARLKEIDYEASAGK